MAKVPFVFYRHSGKATAFSILTNLFGVVFIISAIGGLFEKPQEITATNIAAAVLIFGLGVWLLHLSYKKSPKIAKKDFENKVRDNFAFANKMYAENPRLRTHLLSLNPYITRDNTPESVSQNKNIPCVHQFEERMYNVYFKDSDGLMRDNQEPLMICTRCGISQPKALYEMLNRIQGDSRPQEGAIRAPDTSSNLKEERNRCLWEEIKGEQVSWVNPLEFAWIADGVRQVVTITEVPAIVGRDERYADVIIKDKSVARIHGRIDLYRDSIGNAFKITDLSSTNGTQIDGHDIMTSEIFKPGQTLSFGRVNVSVESK